MWIAISILSFIINFSFLTHKRSKYSSYGRLIPEVKCSHDHPGPVVLDSQDHFQLSSGQFSGSYTELAMAPVELAHEALLSGYYKRKIFPSQIASMITSSQLIAMVSIVFLP